ncbi:MAG: bifunctional oligoribonuclease/PAP phosphatase NrnA [Candidatus Delongbacteria bacterium]|nr:bifunctional oligoribonuclease/PAP phosphatase NrnA [Candidatus Delongbacteria bacterium]MBN2834192.1 bifunctional oligoribonuclease/PAP phosphatase NrnA [Candidatus Delongbacteria bacterium]
MDLKQQIFYEFHKRDNFLIISHYSPDGDNIGSSLAIHRFLQTIGKNSIIVNEDPIPEKYKFLLLPTDRFYTFNDYNENSNFENIIALDCATYDRLGKSTDLISEDHFIINIDHHFTNPCYGNLNLIEHEKAATCQVIYDLLKINDFIINEKIGTPLYNGLVTDTGGFRFSNTTPEVLKIASELSQLGVKPDFLMENAIYANPAEEIKKICSIISKLELYDDIKLVHLYHDDQAEPIKDNDMVLSLLNSINNVEVTLFTRKIESNLLKCSLRSSGYDVSNFASQFGGGGHKQAAGLRFKGTIEDFRELVLKKLIGILENENL